MIRGKNSPESGNIIPNLETNIPIEKINAFLIAKKIAKQAGIKIETAKLLANIETKTGLNIFKNRLKSSKNKEHFSELTDDKIEIAFNIIKNEIKEKSKYDINSLQKELNELSYNFYTSESNSNLGKIMDSAKYSLESLGKISFELVKGIWNTPKDLFFLARGKTTYIPPKRL